MLNHAVTQRLTAIHEWQKFFFLKNRKFVLRELIFYLILLDMK